MKKRYYLSALAILVLSSCGGKENQSQTIDDSSKTSEEIHTKYEEKGSYILEANEQYNPFHLDFIEMDSLSMSTIAIDGFDEVYQDPFVEGYFSNEGTIRRPTSKALEGKCVLYTSNWYTQKTVKRSDDVIEYVLLREDDIWYVESISKSSETFIPFNGAVLSVPKNHSFKYEESDLVELNVNIPVYDIGFYNQKGYRVAISYANRYYFANDGINLIDSNTLAKVTNTAWQKVTLMNCLYDENNNSYIVDKFRINDEKARLYSNINNGFVLGAELNATNTCMPIIEGNRFNLGDVLKVEENAGINEKAFTFDLSKETSYTFSNGTKVNFKIEKSENEYTTNRWGYEIGIDKNGRIVSTDSHLDSIPSGGYKLILTASGSTNSENVNILLSEIFLYGSKVNISGSKININVATSIRAKTYFTQVDNYVKKIVSDIEYYNYSYDYETIASIEQNVSKIGEEINRLNSSIDANDNYKTYRLIGDLYQNYYELVSATSRNEAVQTKSTWYIINFSSRDYDLETLKKNLKAIKDSGVNEIIVDALDGKGRTYYNNSEVFELSNSLKSKSYGEYGSNYYDAIITEAHKLGLSVLANVTPFTVGLEQKFTELKDCYALNMNGGTSVVSSQGKVQMLDPSNELVQQRIAETIDDILKCNPEVDGIALDYIRYGADNNSINTILGITEAALNGFNQYCSDNNYAYNYQTLDSLKNDLRSKPTIFSLFNEYQQSTITNTVRNIKNVCKEYDVPLTCAVADDYSYVKTWKCQDWGSWAKLGIVDALYLMDYYLGEYYIKYFFNDMLKATSNSCLLVTGIDPSYAHLVDEYYATITSGALDNINSMGYGTFGSHTNEAKKDAWNLHSYSNWIDSITFYQDLSETMKASSDLLLKRCDDLYIKYNNQTLTQKQDLENDLNALCALITKENADVCENVMNKLLEMKEKTYASNEANNRIKEQLDAMYRIAKQKKNVY